MKRFYLAIFIVSLIAIVFGQSISQTTTINQTINTSTLSTSIISTTIQSTITTTIQPNNSYTVVNISYTNTSIVSTGNNTFNTIKNNIFTEIINRSTYAAIPFTFGGALGLNSANSINITISVNTYLKTQNNTPFNFILNENGSTLYQTNKTLNTTFQYKTNVSYSQGQIFNITIKGNTLYATITKATNLATKTLKSNTFYLLTPNNSDNSTTYYVDVSTFYNITGLREALKNASIIKLG